MQNRTIPTRFYVVGALIGLLLALVVTARAEAHHAQASGKIVGTYWKCTHNGTRSKGTTRIHIHKTRPSRRHMRRHRCIKRVNKPKATPAPAPIVQTIKEIVFVPQPCPICPATDPKPEEQDCECTRHKHRQGEGHRKCDSGRGHWKDD